MSSDQKDSVTKKSPLSPKKASFVYARTQRYMQALKKSVNVKHGSKDKKVKGSGTPETVGKPPKSGSPSKHKRNKGGGTPSGSSPVKSESSVVLPTEKSSSLPHSVVLEKEENSIRKSNSSSLSNIFKKLSPKFRRAKKGERIVDIYDDTRRQSNSSVEGYDSDTPVKTGKSQPSKLSFAPEVVEVAIGSRYDEKGYYCGSSGDKISSPQRLSSPESVARSSPASSLEARLSPEKNNRLSPDRHNLHSPSSSQRSAELKPPNTLSLRTNLGKLTRQPTEDSIGSCSLNPIATSCESLTSSMTQCGGGRRVFMDTSIITIGSCSLNVDLTSGEELSTKEGERASASQRSIRSDDRLTTTISEVEEMNGGVDHGVMGDGNAESDKRKPSYLGISCMVSGYKNKYTTIEEHAQRINTRIIEEGRRTPTRFRSPIRPDSNFGLEADRNGVENGSGESSSYVRSRVEQFQSLKSEAELLKKELENCATSPLHSEAAHTPSQTPSHQKTSLLVSSNVSAERTKYKQSPSFNKLTTYVDEQVTSAGQASSGAADKTADDGALRDQKPKPLPKPSHLLSPTGTPKKIPFNGLNSNGVQRTVDEKTAVNHCDDGNGEKRRKDGNYFLDLLKEQTLRLQSLSEKFETELANLADPSEEVAGKIRAASGKTSLLISKKFKQFATLCNQNLHQSPDDQFSTTDEDLAGFWDMVLLQVDDVDKLFTELESIKRSGWHTASPVHKPASVTPTNTRSKPKSLTPAAKRATKSAKEAAAAKARVEARKRLAEAKRAARQRTPSGSSDTIEIFVPEK